MTQAIALCILKYSHPFIENICNVRPITQYIKAVHMIMLKACSLKLDFETKLNFHNLKVILWIVSTVTGLFDQYNQSSTITGLFDQYI